MSDASDEQVGHDPAESGEDGDAPVESSEGGDASAESEDQSVEELRRRVEEKYDFDDFGPSDMAEMTVDEWEAAFDHDSWVTGEELIAKIERDLQRRIAERDVFAVVERVASADGELLLAYSDEDYALIYPDGTVEGTGTVLRDVKPTVALCSMDDYEPDPPPEGDFLLPEPGEVPEQSDERGNLMLQVVAAAQLLAGLGLLGSSIYFGVVGGAETGTSLITGVVGLLFLGIALFLFVTVANARLSDRFRAEEYRERLRRIGLDDGERPEFLPVRASEEGLELDPVERREESGE